MQRKVFISFLGPTAYSICKYKINDIVSDSVTFVQSAILTGIGQSFDKYYIVCTKEAEEKNFDSLCKESSQKFDTIRIPNGHSELELWEIFQAIFEEIDYEDIVTMDVTYSFRFIPMLGVTLLQYCKFLKSIHIEYILYGAYDGRDSSNIAPVIDLTSFSLLQDWSNYGSEFISSGKANNLIRLAQNSIRPILKNSKGENKDAVNLKKIADNLERISLNFRTNRGLELIDGRQIIDVQQRIDLLESDLLPPFRPILERIKKEIEPFNRNDLSNLFYGIEWCIAKDLIQEGITLLQESIQTIVLAKVELDYKSKKHREKLSGFLNIYHSQKKPWENLNDDLSIDLICKVEKEFGDSLFDLSKVYCQLSGKRNDINHAGFVEGVEAKKFSLILTECYTKTKELFKP